MLRRDQNFRDDAGCMLLACLVFGGAMGMPAPSGPRYAPTLPRHQFDDRLATRLRYEPTTATSMDAPSDIEDTHVPSVDAPPDPSGIGD